MIQVTVTIGRNVGTEPMAQPDWDRFSDRVRFALANHLELELTDIEEHDGTGKWEHVVEDSTKLSALVDSISGRALDGLRRDLSIICSNYYQDAIALCVGESELVTP